MGPYSIWTSRLDCQASRRCLVYVAERHTLRVRTIPNDTLDGRDDGGGNSKSSSVSEEPANPASHTPVRQTVYRTEVPPSSQRKTMVDPSLPHSEREDPAQSTRWSDYPPAAAASLAPSSFRSAMACPSGFPVISRAGAIFFSLKLLAIDSMLWPAFPPPPCVTNAA